MSVEIIKAKCFQWAENVFKKHQTFSKPGSITYLLYGTKLSEQSINIKFGRIGEFITKEFINLNENFQLLQCGLQIINDKKKDIDLIFINKNTNIIYYRELKANIELDTEKLPATINKCKEIEIWLKNKYPESIINIGILNWSVYNRKILITGLSNIKTFEKENIKIEHFSDFLQIIETEWNENDFYSFFRDLGALYGSVPSNNF